MASRSFSRALRSPLARGLPTPAVQRRTFVSVLKARPAVSALARASIAIPLGQQVRGIKSIDFAGTKETVYGTVNLSSDLHALTDSTPRTRGLAS